MGFPLSMLGRRARPQPISFLMAKGVARDLISLAAGLVDEETLPGPEVRDCICRLLDERGRLPLQYGTTEGLVSLREKVRALGQIRGQYPVLGRGRRVTISADTDTWVYRMTGCGEDDVIVAINKADTPRSVSLPAGTYANLVEGGTVSGGSNMLGARSFLVLTAAP